MLIALVVENEQTNMYAKKIVFSGLTAPALGKCHHTCKTPVAHNLHFFSILVFLHQLAEYQNRRGVEKEREAERRRALLA